MRELILFNAKYTLLMKSYLSLTHDMYVGDVSLNKFAITLNFSIVSVYGKFNHNINTICSVIVVLLVYCDNDSLVLYMIVIVACVSDFIAPISYRTTIEYACICICSHR